jgi:DNA gyrase subunit B
MANTELYENLENIRRRPCMYLGSTDSRGVSLLLFEVVQVAVRDFERGQVTFVEIHLLADGGCRIRDDGPGIPTVEVPGRGLVMVQSTFTTPGRHVVGMQAVAALSRRLEVDVCRDGMMWRQHYDRGVLGGEPLNVGTTSRRGTTITFWPDTDVLRQSCGFDAKSVRNKAQELALLHPGLTVRFIDHRGSTERHEEYHFAKGAADFVRQLNLDRRTVHESVFHFVVDGDGWRVEAAAQWTFERDCNILSFANGGRTSLGGTHEAGFLAALTRVIREFAHYIGYEASGKRGLWGKHCQAGLTAVVSVRVAEPIWRGFRGERLFNSEARRLVEQHVSHHLTQFLLRDADETDLILSRALAARHAQLKRKAARGSRPGRRPPERKA